LMIRKAILILILTLVITSCGGAAPTEAPAPAESPVATEEPTQPVIDIPNTPTVTQTSTPAPTNTPAATPTETPLPTLELPTEVSNPPVRQVWDGVPTYPGDSTRDYYFRLTYDPEVWAQTTDQFGFPALGHRVLPGCIIAVTSGRGLPPSLTVEHDMLQTGEITFDVGTAYENGVKQFVTFTGGDGRIITAFEVAFLEESDACIAQAVAVLSTLQSVHVSRATPVP
jgi:hypothetical protein